MRFEMLQQSTRRISEGKRTVWPWQGSCLGEKSCMRASDSTACALICSDQTLHDFNVLSSPNFALFIPVRETSSIYHGRHREIVMFNWLLSRWDVIAVFHPMNTFLLNNCVSQNRFKQITSSGRCQNILKGFLLLQVRSLPQHALPDLWAVFRFGAILFLLQKNALIPNGRCKDKWHSVCFLVTF